MHWHVHLEPQEGCAPHGGHERWKQPQRQAAYRAFCRRPGKHCKILKVSRKQSHLVGEDNGGVVIVLIWRRDRQQRWRAYRQPHDALLRALGWEQRPRMQLLLSCE